MTADTRPPMLGGVLRLPVLGHALEFYRNPVALIERGRRRFGDVYSLVLAGRRVMVLTGPKAHQAFFHAPDDVLSQREVYQFMVPIFGKGIVYDSPPPLMDEQLGFVFPALRDERLRRYTSIMEEETERYLDGWGDEGVVDLYNATNELTTFIASRCLIGEEFRQRLTTEFAGLYKDLEGGINFIAFVNPRLPTPAHRRRDRARVRVVEIIAEIIAERRASGRVGEDFLQTLMDARYQDGSAPTEDGITGLLLALIFAGQHTSAVLAAWSGILLHQHPRFLPAVLDEQRQMFADSSEVTLDKLRRMEVLNRAIMEAERLHPPLIVMMRSIQREFAYGGYVGGPGELALVSPAVSHRIPEVFRDPQRYDPDRFAPPREEHKQAAFTLIGFGGGKHRCIGMAFAYLQVKALWSVILRRYRLELVEPAYAPNYATFVVGPRQPCRVRYQRRGRVLLDVPRGPTTEVAKAPPESTPEGSQTSMSQTNGRHAPPDFAAAENRRQKVRSAGMNPDYWYPVERSRRLKPGAAIEVCFWKRSIAVYRGQDGGLRAIENRCAHRQLKLSLGSVENCHLVCPYHGWEYDGTGQVVHIPHDLFGRSMPSFRVRSYPVKERYGLIWLFPGDPALSETRQIPEIAELEGPQAWACVPIDFTWRAHHSMIIDNVSDFSHAHLHRRYSPFTDAKLTRLEAVGDRVYVSYDAKIGRGRITRHFVDHGRVNTNHMDLCYEYPYQWSNTDGKIKHWCFVLPIDERTTRTFFLFYFESLKVPLLPVKIPRQLMRAVLEVANLLHIKPLLKQDGFAVQAEQEGYEAHFDAPIAELNPAVALFQQLTIRKWEEHLAGTQATAAEPTAPVSG